VSQQESRVWWSEPQVNVFEMAQYDARFDRLRSHGFDPATLWDRVSGDIELLRDLVRIFTEEYPTLLDDLGKAIEQHSFSDVQKLSHKLKGSAMQFSGKDVAEMAGLLERMGQERSLDGAARVFATLQQEVAELVHSLRSMVNEIPIG
jgi:HPt (histidine-containing phosphotransfer) domain-containing protein